MDADDTEPSVAFYTAIRDKYRKRIGESRRVIREHEQMIQDNLRRSFEMGRKILEQEKKNVTTDN